MIYGLLWLAFVGFFLSIRHAAPMWQAKAGAVAGVALSASAWFCYLTRFEPGPTPPAVVFPALGLFALVTVWSFLALAVRLLPGEPAMEWSPTVDISLMLLSTFVFGVGLLGYSAAVAITGGMLIMVLSSLIGRQRRER